MRKRRKNYAVAPWGERYFQLSQPVGQQLVRRQGTASRGLLGFSATPNPRPPRSHRKTLVLFPQLLPPLSAPPPCSAQAARASRSQIPLPHSPRPGKPRLSRSSRFSPAIRASFLFVRGWILGGGPCRRRSALVLEQWCFRWYKQGAELIAVACFFFLEGRELEMRAVPLVGCVIWSLVGYT